MITRIVMCWGILLLQFAHGQDSTASHALETYYTPANILRFAKYLSDDGDFLRAAAEYERFLYMTSDADTADLNYQIGRCYVRAHQPQDAVVYFERSLAAGRTASFADSARLALAGVHLLNGRYDSVADVLASTDKDALTDLQQQQSLVLNSLSLLMRKRWQAAHEVLAHSSGSEEAALQPLRDLDELAQRGMRLPAKSPAVGALMSAIIPGSGRWYVNRRADGFYSLFLIAGASWLAYEGFDEAGLESPKGWIFGSLAAVLYSGNIYGSAVAVRLYNQRVEGRLTADVKTRLDMLVHF